jgi:hypothetical protein
MGKPCAAYRDGGAAGFPSHGASILVDTEKGRTSESEYAIGDLVDRSPTSRSALPLADNPARNQSRSPMDEPMSPRAGRRRKGVNEPHLRAPRQSCGNTRGHASWGGGVA